MKKSIFILIFILAINSLTLGETSFVDINLANFDIEINGTSIDNSKQTYPFITYKNMTYMPLTWNIANGLGIKTKWDSLDGLSITRISKTSTILTDQAANNDMSLTYQASIVNFPVTINGKTVYAFESQLPFLSFKGVTYMPLTYDYLTNELFGESIWDPQSGLKIRTDRSIPQNHIGYHGITDDYKSILREWLNQMNFSNQDKWLHYLNTGFHGKVLGLFQYNNDLEVTQIINNETLTYLLDKSKWKDDIKVVKFSNLELIREIEKSYGISSPYTADKLGTISMLNLDGVYLQSLTDLDKFYNLEIFSIENYSNNDLKNIRHLGALDNLNISSILKEETPLDVSFINDMSSLRSLSIKNYPIKSNLDLGKLYQLENLYLTSCDLNNLDAIKDLNSLKELSISKNNLSSLEGIQNNDQLERIYGHQNEITSLDTLENLYKLKVISMPNNKLEKIDVLAKSTKLKEIYLANNNISALPDLSKLTLLKSIDLSENALTDIRALYKCKTIEYLNIGHTNIDSILGISHLKNLERFYFDQTFIKDIQSLAKLENIECIELSSYVRDLSPLVDMTKLDNLIFRDQTFEILINHEETLNELVSNNPNLTIVTDYYGQSNDDNLSYAYCTYKEVEGDYDDIKSGKAKRTAHTVISLVKSITSDDMSDYEKVYAIHKYICHRLDYGYASANKVSSYSMAYVPVNVLHSNMALSPGYTRLMDSFLNIAGIETRIIKSNTSPYVWNLVKVDDKWYHIDLTRNDSLGNSSSSKWRLFLVSDEKMMKTGERTWDQNRYPTCPKSYSK